MATRMGILVLAGSSALALGCTDDCVDACHGEQECADAPSALEAANCEDVCRDLEDVGTRASCSKPIDAFTRCDAKLSDRCGDTGCDAEWNTALTCIATYCDEHPHDAKCDAIFAELGGPSDTAP